MVMKEVSGELAREPIVEFRDVSLSFGDKVVLSHLQLSIPENGIYCLLGQSGSGKTTCLRLMNGLMEPDDGIIFLNGNPLDYAKAIHLRRSMGYVQQGGGLFPHMTAFENLGLIAKKSGWSKEKIVDRVKELLNHVHLDYKEIANKYPSQLSGGQKQRISIARSLFLYPKIILMDEPFGALDPATREELQDLFIELQKVLHLTVVIVTHDLYEAFKMADKIILLNQGKVEQIGSQGQLLLSPASEYVKQYLSPMKPRRRLDLLKLYMIMSTDIYTIHESGGAWVLCHLGSKIKTNKTSLAEALSFIENKQQEIVCVVDKQGKLIKVLSTMGQQDLTIKTPTFYGKDSFLNCMKSFVRNEFSKILVLNNEDKVVGFLSSESIDDI
ncbi:MAG: ABC transporter ATP-binding protein [Bdellovibrionaceae bacterium]|nr:ABC transporter ATP-binding protein [Pseudobdellovibrionaceae bacterium]